MKIPCLTLTRLSLERICNHCRQSTAGYGCALCWHKLPKARMCRQRFQTLTPMLAEVPCLTLSRYTVAFAAFMCHVPITWQEVIMPIWFSEDYWSFWCIVHVHRTHGFRDMSQNVPKSILACLRVEHCRHSGREFLHGVDKIDNAHFLTSGSLNLCFQQAC